MERAYGVNANGRSERTLDDRVASFSSHLKSSSCSFSSVHKFYLVSFKVSGIQAPTSPSARCHVLLLTYSSSRVAMGNNIDTSFSHHQHSCQQQHLPHMHGACGSTRDAACRLDHSTNLRVRCKHCRYCATKPQWDAASSHCSRRVDVDEDEDKRKR